MHLLPITEQTTDQVITLATFSGNGTIPSNEQTVSTRRRNYSGAGLTKHTMI